MKKVLLILLAVIFILSSSVCVCAQEKFKLGDVTQDGVVSIIDATEIQSVLAGLSKGNENFTKLADVDGDRVVSIMDATCVQMYLAQKIDRFPSENITPTTPSIDSDGYYDQIVKP